MLRGESWTRWWLSREETVGSKGAAMMATTGGTRMNLSVEVQDDVDRDKVTNFPR
jgi:hypothetical protein